MSTSSIIDSDLPCLDRDVLESLRDIMQDDFHDLIETFVKDARLRCQVLHNAQQQGDLDALRRAAHSFKGSSANIGAHRLSDLCRQLEDGLVNGSDISLPSYLASIESASAEVLAQLEQFLAT